MPDATQPAIHPLIASASGIRCLVPDLPDADSLLPWLRRIDSNRWYTNFGPLNRELEDRIAEFVGVPQGGKCVTLSSGTAALELALVALGLGPGRRVLLPALTFPATLLAVQRCGAIPVLTDVCPTRWTLTPEIARSVLAHQHCDAVIPVATFGAPLPADEWDRFAAETGTEVIVDAAGALGTQRVGTRAHWAFSLHATKPLGVGEGGVLATPDEATADRVRRLSNFGFDHAVVRVAGATNAKLGEYAAAIGLAQLDRWPAMRRRRTENLQRYRQALGVLRGVQLQDGLADDAPPAVLCARLPLAVGTVGDMGALNDPDDAGNAGDRNAVARATHAADIGSALAERGIETRRWYLPPLDEHPAFAGIQVAGPDGTRAMPATHALAQTLLGLPFHTYLHEHDIDRVAAALAECLRR